MSVSMVLRVAAGNALRVFLAPPASARAWRLLRRVDDAFAGAHDPDALLVHEGNAPTVLDSTSLINGVAVWYRAYYWDGTAWTASASVTATPAASYEDGCVDALSVVRDRLDDGLLVEVTRGALRHETGAIPVLTAPPVYDDTRWPVVTVHLQDEGPSQRWIGENATGDYNDLDYVTGLSSDSEGYLASTQLTIIGWSLNPDERKTLRKAIRRILVANLPVFDEHGLVQIEFRQQDTEDFNSYSAPVYQVMTSFSCLTPMLVSAPGADLITDVMHDITTP